MSGTIAAGVRRVFAAQNFDGHPVATRDSYDEVRKIVIGIIEKKTRSQSQSEINPSAKKPDQEKKP
ncbi:MAG: hypothetical protein ACREA2_15830 [Blastocatellia bacterium]